MSKSTKNNRSRSQRESERNDLAVARAIENRNRDAYDELHRTAITHYLHYPHKKQEDLARISSFPKSEAAKEMKSMTQMYRINIYEAKTALENTTARITYNVEEKTIPDFKRWCNATDLNSPMIPIMYEEWLERDDVPIRTIGEMALFIATFKLDFEKVRVLLQNGVVPSRNNYEPKSLQDAYVNNMNESIARTFEGLMYIKYNGPKNAYQKNKPNAIKIISELIQHGAQFEEKEEKLSNYMRMPETQIDIWTLMDEKNKQNDAFWKSRRNIIMLSEGIPVAPENESHILGYLGNEWLQREIATYMDKEKPTIEERINRSSFYFDRARRLRRIEQEGKTLKNLSKSNARSTRRR